MVWSFSKLYCAYFLIDILRLMLFITLFLIVYLPWINLAGAHTSNRSVLFSFNTQWYSNISGSTQLCSKEEQLNKAARIFHSYSFLGHLWTVFIVFSESVHRIAFEKHIESEIWKTLAILAILSIKIINIKQHFLFQTAIL